MLFRFDQRRSVSFYRPIEDCAWAKGSESHSPDQDKSAVISDVVDGLRRWLGLVRKADGFEKYQITNIKTERLRTMTRHDKEKRARLANHRTCA